MKIIKIRLYSVAIPYKHLYTIAPGSVKFARRVIAEFITDTGLSGIGETGVTVPERGGETQESIISNMQHYFAPLVLGAEPFDVSGVIQKIENSHWGKTGFLVSKCLVDNVLYDLQGKAYGLPVYKLLGGMHRDSITVSRSLGVKSPSEMGQEALERKAEGYAVLTVKAGFDPQVDIERLAAVRDAVGSGYPLEVDVNGGYPSDVAVSTLRKMQRSYDIKAVEQPCPWWDLDGMAKVAQTLDIPVIADESVWTAHDVYHLAKCGAADTICIKVIKNGGLFLSRKIAETAEACGLGVTLGSKHPLGPGTAAILHFAAAMPMVEMPVGYGCPSERLIDDIIQQPLQMIDGKVKIPEGPGLGITLDYAKLEQYKCAEMVEI